MEKGKVLHIGYYDHLRLRFVSLAAV